jgi:putative PIN family toxin of toxin-antitoxin system
MRTVFDANVVASAVCWSGEPYLCLVKMARRQVFAFGTSETLEETRAVATEVIREKKPKHNAAARLTWYLESLKLVDAAPLGKQRSRDAKDDPYLAAALAARADCLVTFDKDLLSLGKPFGVPIISPAQFLKALKG